MSKKVGDAVPRVPAPLYPCTTHCLTGGVNWALLRLSYAATPPSSAVRIVLLDIKVGVRNVSKNLFRGRFPLSTPTACTGTSLYERVSYPALSDDKSPRILCTVARLMRKVSPRKSSSKPAQFTVSAEFVIYNASLSCQ